MPGSCWRLWEVSASPGRAGLVQSEPPHSPGSHGGRAGFCGPRQSQEVLGLLQTGCLASQGEDVGPSCQTLGCPSRERPVHAASGLRAPRLPGGPFGVSEIDGVGPGTREHLLARDPCGSLSPLSETALRPCAWGQRAGCLEVNGVPAVSLSFQHVLASVWGARGCPAPAAGRLPRRDCPGPGISLQRPPESSSRPCCLSGEGQTPPLALAGRKQPSRGRGVPSGSPASASRRPGPPAGISASFLPAPVVRSQAERRLWPRGPCFPGPWRSCPSAAQLILFVTCLPPVSVSAPGRGLIRTLWEPGTPAASARLPSSSRLLLALLLVPDAPCSPPGRSQGTPIDRQRGEPRGPARPAPCAAHAVLPRPLTLSPREDSEASEGQTTSLVPQPLSEGGWDPSPGPSEARAHALPGAVLPGPGRRLAGPA